jgi:hypothetical protein
MATRWFAARSGLEKQCSCRCLRLVIGGFSKYFRKILKIRPQKTTRDQHFHRKNRTALAQVFARQLLILSFGARLQPSGPGGIKVLFLRRPTVKKWQLVLTQGALAGSLASIFSTAVLAIAGRRQVGSAVAPINAVSHVYWGDEALHRERLDLNHTALGYLTHHASSIFWAAVYAGLCRDKPATRTALGIVSGAAGLSAAACFIDYRLIPKRLTPGFEHRLSTEAMAGVYAALALGFAAGALALRDGYNDKPLQSQEEDEESPEPEQRITRRRRAGSVFDMSTLDLTL